MKTAYFVRVASSLGAALLVAACGSSDAEDDALLRDQQSSQAIETAASAPTDSGSAPAPSSASSAPAENDFHYIVRHVWTSAGMSCGLEASPKLSPDALLAMVPEADRLPTILAVLETDALTPGESQALLALAGLTGDPGAAPSLVAYWDRAMELVERHLAKYEGEIAATGYDFQASEEQLQTMIDTVRVGVLRGAAGPVGDSATLDLLARALGEQSQELRLEAILSLVRRTDFTDMGRLMAARASLHPNATWQVDQALAARGVSP